MVWTAHANGDFGVFLFLNLPVYHMSLGMEQMAMLKT